MESEQNHQPDKKERDSQEYEPLGKLYDDPREHGSATTQRVDEGTKERDDAGNISENNQKNNAGGSPSRSNSSIDYPAEGHGNG